MKLISANADDCLAAVRALSETAVQAPARSFRVQLRNKKTNLLVRDRDGLPVFFKRLLPWPPPVLEPDVRRMHRPWLPAGQWRLWD